MNKMSDFNKSISIFFSALFTNIYTYIILLIISLIILDYFNLPSRYLMIKNFNKENATFIKTILILLITSLLSIKTVDKYTLNIMNKSTQKLVFELTKFSKDLEFLLVVTDNSLNFTYLIPSENSIDETDYINQLIFNINNYISEFDRLSSEKLVLKKNGYTLLTQIIYMSVDLIEILNSVKISDCCFTNDQIKEIQILSEKITKLNLMLPTFIG